MNWMKYLLAALLALFISIAAYMTYEYFMQNCISPLSTTSPIALLNINGSQILADQREIKTITDHSNVTTIITKFLRPGDNILQVGAGIGYESVFMGKIIGPTGRLFIFQPNNNSLLLLKNNLKINDLWNNSHIFEQAAFSNDGVVFIETYERDMNYYRVLMQPSDAVGGVLKQVMATRIDDSLAKRYNIDLMYLNCYGSELQALMGAQSIINNSPNLSILMAWKPELMNNYSDIKSIINNLTYLKFEFWDVNNPDRPKLLTKDKLLNGSFEHVIITKTGTYRD